MPLLPRSTTQPAIRSAYVLGSTSAVAMAICHQLARSGCRRFHLVARNTQANASLAESLRHSCNAEVSLETCDLLADSALMAPRPRIDADYDLYLITAGSLGDPELAQHDAGEALAITAANYSGLLPWLTAIATPERLARPGRLWVFSSVAADRGRPSNYVYGAAKAALTVFCEGLLLRCHGGPFAVRVLKAGFMATPMTEGKAPPALCASPESIARSLLSSPNKRGIHYIPFWWAGIMALVRSLPAGMASRM
jgi:decaprenylphospho-beta-D-erythro-pentofuranosid-2-ulose 2-reductase